MSESKPVFVLGFDGVPWNLVEKWTASGDLPNLARIVDEGATGPLESTTPATTPLAWPSIATGVRPDKHGSYWFRELQSDYTHRVRTSDRIRGPMLWDLLSPAAVANVPMTYPAREIDGVVVSGMMTPENRQGFTFPPELATDIDERIPGYEIGLTWGEYDGSTSALHEDLRALVENCRDLMRLLLERAEWRLTFFVYTFPDRLQHLVWEEDVLREYYARMDDIVGEAMEYVEERDGTLYVVSDHGFGPIEKTVSVNAALADAGLLGRRDDAGVRGSLSRLGVTKTGVLGALDRVGVDESTLVRYLPDAVTDRVASQIPGEHVLYDVDYDTTSAFAYGPGHVYVNDTERFDRGTVDPDDRKAVARDARVALEAITDPDTGERVLDVFDGTDIFPTDPDAPDLAVEPREGYEAVTSLREDAVAPATKMNASHRPEGIFLAWGPDVDAGSVPADASVYDVTPTVLHAAGEPVPDRVDGRVLDEIFAPGSPPAETDVRTTDYDDTDGDTASGEGRDDFDDVEDRLRGLGYID